MTDEALMPRPSIEGIEAECRQKMAALAAMPDRGFDTAKVKQKKRAELDDALDLYNAIQGA